MSLAPQDLSQVCSSRAWIDSWVEVGLDSAFGVPGGVVAHLFDALVQALPHSTFVVQQESQGPFAAVGRYVADSERLGGTGSHGFSCVFATAGPGALQMLNGLVSAELEGVPMLAVTADVPQSLQGEGAVQDGSARGTNVSGVYRSALRHSFSPTSISEWRMQTYRAQELIRVGRLVHFHLSYDLLSKSIDRESGFPVERDVPQVDADLDSGADVFIELLERNFGDVGVVLGSGVRSSGRIGKVAEFLASHEVPFWVTSHAKGSRADLESTFQGYLGLAVPGDGRERFEKSSLNHFAILGSALGECTTNAWSLNLGSKRLHRFDWKEPTSGWMKRHLVSNHQTNFYNWTAMHLQVRRNSGARVSRETKVPSRMMVSDSAREDLVNPALLFDRVDSELGNVDAFHFPDIGGAMLWAFQRLKTRNTSQMFVSLGLGSMGSGIGAALGASAFFKMRNLKTRALCWIGDSATLMAGNEVFTAVDGGLDLKLIVLNDGQQGTGVFGLKQMERNPAPLVKRKPVDFARWAEGLGARGYTIRNEAELLAFDFEAWAREPGVAVIDVRIDPSVPPPIQSRLKGLGVPGLMFEDVKIN